VETHDKYKRHYGLHHDRKSRGVEGNKHLWFEFPLQGGIVYSEMVFCALMKERYVFPLSLLSYGEDIVVLFNKTVAKYYF